MWCKVLKIIENLNEKEKIERNAVYDDKQLEFCFIY